MISLYTTCKGRLRHLRQTLPHNIEIASGSKSKVEMVVLDYASADGLSEWIKDTQTDNINKGIVNYYSYSVPGDFWIAHAKNLAASMCTNEIICSVDADHFITREFLDYIASIGKDEYISSCENDKIDYSIWGCITCWKSDFLALGGYNENLTGYGFDDRDFCNRLDKLGRKKRTWTGDLVKYIKHGRDERIMHYGNKNIFKMMENNENISRSSTSIRPNQGKDWAKGSLKKNFVSVVDCSRGVSRTSFKMF